MGSRIEYAGSLATQLTLAHVKVPKRIKRVLSGPGVRHVQHQPPRVQHWSIEKKSAFKASEERFKPSIGGHRYPRRIATVIAK